MSVKKGALRLCTLGMMSVLMLLSQVAMQALPNIELVSFFILFSTLHFGLGTLGAVAVFVLGEGMIYGFDPTWFLGYCVIWPLLVLLTRALRKPLLRSNLFRALFSGAFGLCFGLMYALLQIPFLGLAGAAGYYVAGLPFDALHMLGNYFLMLALGPRAHGLFATHAARMQAAEKPKSH